MSVEVVNTQIPETKVVEGKEFPLTYSPKAGISLAAACEWAQANRDRLVEQVCSHGAILFRGFPLSTPEEFDAFFQALHLQNMPYVGGAAVRTNDPKKAVVLGNGEAVDAAVLEDVYEFMLKERVSIKWHKGDLIFIDNGVTMHSRNPFNPPRRILASLARGLRPLPGQGAQAVASFTLKRTGDKFPAVGFGCWKIPQNVTASMVFQALALGYRHLDCASDYGNEKEVGLGIKAAIDAGVVKREDVFVVSKLWNTYHAREHVRPALEKTLSDLGLGYVDLYLIHFPIALKYVPFDKRYPAGWFYDPESESPKMEEVPVSVRETWEAMESLVTAGLARNIGVSNFSVALIRDLLSYATIKPDVLQVELHPYNTQEKLLRFCKEKDILVTGFSPLGAGSYVELGMATQADSALNHKIVQQIAQEVKRTPAQVILRWAFQRGTAVVPKTNKPTRLAENMNIFDFELTEQQMSAVAGLNSGTRFNDPGVFCEKAFNTFFPIYE
eukprot:Colp12_sorted_trinity150504_noHs@25283